MQPVGFSDGYAFVIEPDPKMKSEISLISWFYNTLMERTDIAIGHIRLDKLRAHHLEAFYKNPCRTRDESAWQLCGFRKISWHTQGAENDKGGIGERGQRFGTNSGGGDARCAH